MTGEEIINNLLYMKRYVKEDTIEDSTIDEAIKALEQQPCEDCISRQAVDELSKELVHTTRDKADFLCNFWEGLQKLPPVTPKEKTGKWINEKWHGVDLIGVTCSNCNVVESRFSAYCPNCGAKMQEVENDT